MDILNLDLNNMNRGNTSEDYPDIIILIKILAGYMKFEKRKELKRKLHEELMPIAWHTNRWRNFCVSEDKQKDLIKIILIEQL